VSNYGANTVSVLTGDGDGTFGARFDLTTPAGPTAVTASDLNGDGALDLATSNWTAASASIFLNTTPQPPAITSANNATFGRGTANTFTVSATGTPTVTLTVSGTLPSGVTFTDNGNSTATLAGTPTTSGAFPLTITASNTSGPNAAQNFTLTVTGPLSISVPSTADLGSGAPAGTISANLGTVTVTDVRNDVTASWTATVSGTDFTTGGGTAAETITRSAVSYWSGPATSTTGVGTFTPGQSNAGNAQTLTTSRTAFSMGPGTGNNTASWNPSLRINVPAAAVAGTYIGTVTHTVL
jgi:hypothetical protein